MRCPKCNTKNDGDSNYCGNCGAALQHTTQPDNPTHNSAPIMTRNRASGKTGVPRLASRTNLLWSTVALFVLALGAVGFVMYSAKRNASPPPSVLTSTHMTATVQVIGTVPATATVPVTVTTASVLAQKVAVPSYFAPGAPGWVQIENSAATSSLAVINPNSGPGASQDQNYVDQVNQAEKSGLVVVGYIYTSYAGTQDHTRTLVAAERDVDSYYRWYPTIKGIFIDEVSTDCGSSYATYYKPLYDYIKHKVANAEVILNPGTNTSECYISASDIIVNFDDTYSNYLKWSPVPWVANYSASRFWQVIYSASPANMPQVVTLSKQRSAGWVYITDQGGDNPFASLPSYWNSELLLVKHS